MSKQAKRPLTQAEKRNRLISWGWLMVSLAAALVVWFCLSIGEKTGRSFPGGPTEPTPPRPALIPNSRPPGPY